jgi:hypothetical protein
MMENIFWYASTPVLSRVVTGLFWVGFLATGPVAVVSTLGITGTVAVAAVAHSGVIEYGIKRTIGFGMRSFF